MVFGPIQFGGIASGLDTGAIVDALVAASRRPIDLLEADKSIEQEKLDLLGDLEKLVDDLREKSYGLSTLDGFIAQSITPSQEGYATLGLSGAAQTGTHTLEVNALAKATRVSFDGVADSDTTELGTGSITFSYDGTDYTIDITDSADSTLDGIAAAINSAAGEAVTASVINTGASTDPYKLVIAGNDTGVDFDFDPVVTGIGLTNQVDLTSATDAEIVVDGLTVYSSTNQFNEVLDGVEINAQALTSGEMTFNVDADTEGIKTRIDEFVDAYNAVIGFINTQNEYSEDAGAGGELFGDTALSSVRTALQSALFDVDISVVQADTEGYSTLGLVGIDLQSDGTLLVDDATLDEKLATDIDLFADLFVDTDGFDNGDAEENTADYYIDTTADTGVLDDLFRAIDQMVDDVQNEDGDLIKGLFGRRKDTVNANIERIDDQIERLEERLASYEETLILRFAALEELMAGLNAQQSYIGSVQSFGASQG